MGLILLCLCIGLIGVFIIKKSGPYDCDFSGLVCSSVGFAFTIILIIVIIIEHSCAPAHRLKINEQYNQINYEFNQCAYEGATDELNKILVAHDISEWNSNFKQYEYWRNNFWTNVLYPDVYAGLEMFEYPNVYNK